MTMSYAPKNGSGSGRSSDLNSRGTSARLRSDDDLDGSDMQRQLDEAVLREQQRRMHVGSRSRLGSEDMDGIDPGFIDY